MSLPVSCRDPLGVILGGGHHSLKVNVEVVRLAHAEPRSKVTR
jgi:hypothetical protein